MNDPREQLDLPDVVGTGTIVGLDMASGPSRSVVILASSEGVVAQIPEGPLERAAFVRFHVGEIIKKHKTVASHKTKGKLLLEKSEAARDTGAGDEARAQFLMAERSELLIEEHFAALIARTATV